ncbi:MAG TPA: hypothetical protein VE178_14805 [Silvibacterium sp.]|jgi:hypothetical protein|nr:hypothetical protein [Silvibacterium sp.]
MFKPIRSTKPGWLIDFNIQKRNPIGNNVAHRFRVFRQSASSTRLVMMSFRTLSNVVVSPSRAKEGFMKTDSQGSAESGQAAQVVL